MEQNKAGTAELRLLNFLIDEANVTTRVPYGNHGYDYGNGFDECVIRKPFETLNGHTVSIQQGASHYCNKDANTFEVWCTPRTVALSKYGDGESPYGHVQFADVVAHIEELESEAPAGSVAAEEGE